MPSRIQRVVIAGMAACALSCDDTLERLAEEIEVAVERVAVVPPCADAEEVSGTAVLVIGDCVGVDGCPEPVTFASPRLAALAPGLSVDTVSPALALTDESGRLPIKFTTARFPFSVVVRLPWGVTGTAEIEYELPAADIRECEEPDGGT